jgi:predicted dehydrogenase
MTRPRVALIGIHGHGRVHLRNIRRLAEVGRLELAGVADLVAPDAEALLLLGGAPWTVDWAAALEHARPDVVVVASPLHLHARMTIAALRAGADVLLEKPPALCPAEHDAIASAARNAGRVCQVGFQTLGADAPRELRRLVADGALGRITQVSAVGRWQRPRAYWTRSPWAGRLELDGVPVLDGALTNPFAHALVTAVAALTDPSDVVVDRLELDLYRANLIETHDTGALRLRLRGLPPVTVAATLCAETSIPPRVTVHGSLQSATLRYEEDTLTVGALSRQFSRHDLLTNLLDHRADQTPLLAPLAATRFFATVIDAVAGNGPPAVIDSRWLQDTQDGLVVVGVDDAVEAAASGGALLRETGVPWSRLDVVPETSARPPVRLVGS